MKRFVDGIFQIVKDPPLRADIMPAIHTYLVDPFSEEGHESANLVLQYLDNSPMVPVLRPAEPVTTWTDQAEKMVTGSGSQLLRAYVIGGASAALQGKDASHALTVAAQQMIRIYLKMKEKYPSFVHPALEQLKEAVHLGEGSEFLRERMEAAAKEATASQQ